MDDTLNRDDLAVDLALPVGEMEGGLDGDWEGCECTQHCATVFSRLPGTLNRIVTIIGYLVHIES